MVEAEVSTPTAAVETPAVIETSKPGVLRRNVKALITDSGAFGGALGFMGYSTVVPSLVLALTNSEPLVGLITTIWAGAWLLPQLPAGRWMAGRPRKKPILLWSAFIGRSGIAVFALLLAMNLDRAWLFILFALALTLFRGMDAISAVAWFDIISKVLPLNVRGRALGWMQTGAFISQFLTSFVVTWALGTSGPNFPLNYALLIFGAALCLATSSTALLFLVEPASDVSSNVSGQLSIGAHAWHILKSDRAFRQSSIARVLLAIKDLAISFYVVHATQELGIARSTIGLFLAAQTLGGVVGSLILGAISERRGSQLVIRLSMFLSMVPPVMALLMNFVGAANVTLATIGYVIVFAAIGATDGSFLLGFLQYILDIAPPVERTAYTGLANTIGGLLVIAPTIGGIVLQATSFPVLFLAALAGPILGLIVAWGLPRVISNE